MIQQLRFYAAHSWNDLRSNGQRTFFALLCIAAGVAAIVSLQTLAAMIQNTLTSNLQESNRADMRVLPASTSSDEGDEALQKAVAAGLLVADTLSFGGNQGTQYYFSQPGLDALEQWATTTYPGAEVSYRQSVTNVLSLFTSSGQGVAMTNPTSNIEASGIYPVMIQADRYPYYSAITGEDGTPLSQMLQQPTDLVLNNIIAEKIGVSVGDTVTLQGVETPFTVRGIVPTDAEVRNPTQDFLAALNGFYIMDVRSRELFTELPVRADNVYLKLPATVDVIAAAKALSSRFSYVRSVTTEDLRRTYTLISENVNRLVTVMGLIALLLGSIGIINTMQVIVRRRILEIAVLKTIGLQSNQITTLFLVEAAIMGVLGSVFGVLLGWVLVFIIRGVAEGLLGQPLPFIFVPSAILAGVVVGTLVTTVFGFIPTLSAGKVRPARVLRPDDNLVPRAGLLATFASLVLVIIALSLVAATILGDLAQAFAVIIGAFIMAGILFVLLLLVIWLVGRFLPSFGLIDLKIALREMSVTRSRAAVTLLALVVGVFSLSLITLLANTVTQSISQLLQTDNNIFLQVPNETTLTQVEARIAALDGEKTTTVNYSYRFIFDSITKADGTTLSRDAIQATLEATDPFASFRSTPVPGQELSQDERRRQEAQRERRINEFGQIVGAIGVVDPDQVAGLDGTGFVSGRQFIPTDSGNLIVLTDTDTLRDLGLQAGDTLNYTYSVGGFLGLGAQSNAISYTILGIAPTPTTPGLGGQTNSVLRATIPTELAPNSITIVANIAPDQITPLRTAIADLPQTYLIETAVFTRLFEALLGQFTAFPLLVALLGLVVGGVVIANSVALSTMERRREIAVMKSIGLQRERVLGMLLIENAILGLIGGIVGVGLGLVGLLVLLQGQAEAPISWPTILLLMGLCVAVALIAALTTAWGASGEKPLNVLRYE